MKTKSLIFNEQKFEISPQVIKNQNLIPHKEKTGKTMFKLPVYAFNFINSLSEIDGVNSNKCAIDIIVERAKSDYEKNNLEFFDIPEESIRKSITISNKSKDILARITREKNISRDNVFYSAIINIINLISVKKINIDEKIKYAKILHNMAKKMLEIYESKEVLEAREKLLACNDNDFGNTDDFQSCNNLLGYIEQLYELPSALEGFINMKENEKNNQI